MQLIYGTEPNIGIKKDMENLNEPLNEKLIENSKSEEPKTDMFEINKEDILSQDNVFEGAGTASGYNKKADESVTDEIKTDLKNKEVGNRDTEITLDENIDTNVTRTEDNVVENGFKNTEDQESRELHSNNVCMKYKDNFSENKENPKTVYKEKVVKNAAANADTKGNEQVISDMEANVDSEMIKLSKKETENIAEIKKKIIDDFEIDKESNDDDENIDLIQIQHKLCTDEETTLNDDETFINQKDVIDNEEENIANGTERKECTEMEIPETSETSKNTYDDKSVANDGTKSNQDTAIPSVEDQQSCFIKEALSDSENKLSSTDNLEKDVMETDDASPITLPDEPVKTAADKQEQGLDDNITNLEKKTIKSINVTQVLSDATKNIAVNVLDTLNLENDDGNITHTPLMDESEETAAVSHESAMEVDDSATDLEHECIEAGDIIQTPLIDESKEAAADLQEKVVGVDNNINDLENTESGDTSLIEESNKTSEDLPGNVIDLENIKDIVKETGEIVINTAQIKVIATPAPEENITVMEESKKRKSSLTCKLSNTLNILSDDEEDEPPKITENSERQLKVSTSEKQCINIEDDDDVMLIDEDTDNNTESHNSAPAETQTEISNSELKENYNNNSDITMTETVKLISDNNNKECTSDVTDIIEQPQIDEQSKNQTKSTNGPKPLLPENFLQSAKKNVADMTKDELEEFCILKIVESILDRSSLNDVKTKLTNAMQIIKEQNNKAKMLTKQNRDLQIVMKSIQEELKKKTDGPITPLKITRSVGLQVLIPGEEPMPKRNVMPATNPAQVNVNASNKQIKSINPGPRPQRPVQANNQNHSIPVPRLVPATQNNTTIKAPVSNQVPSVSNQLKTNTPATKNATPAQKTAEKRPHNRVQSVTVDLTDDEPPAKVTTRSSPAQPVRLVPSQNLMATQRPFLQNNNSSPRKVYIPISGQQTQNLRTGQYMLKSVSPSPGLRPKASTPQARMHPNQIRVQRMNPNRHPAPLPDAMKQYQPPNWKALPPAPDIKLSKVENGIVISWKIEGYQSDVHEEIASYQLYAYQETSSPPSTSLWKKIGDVKALPLPMACTLTQFMAGFKYYFAVRAVDVRSRVGIFSSPGNILLLNKM